jgi:rubredoxin
MGGGYQKTGERVGARDTARSRKRARPATVGAMIECGMCGHEFTREEGAACQAGCPVSKGCGLVTCPACGYEFPPTSRIVELITSLVKPKRAAGAR